MLLSTHGIAGEVVGRRRASCSDAHLENSGEMTGAGSWAWPAGPVSVALGPGAEGSLFLFLAAFSFYFSH